MKVPFSCTANSCRKDGQRSRVQAGWKPGGVTSKSIESFGTKEPDYVIALCESVRKYRPFSPARFRSCYFERV